ncbi:MAG: 50S ribosomal protein L10 [Planctomycetota bacterium]
MSRAVKEFMTQEYKSSFEGLEHCVFVNFANLTAEDSGMLRGRLAEREMELRVIRNNLARRAFEDVGISGVGEFFEGRIAVITGGNDAIEIAKTIKDLTKDIKGEVIQLRAGVLEREVFGPDRVQLLATMPGRTELMQRIVGLILSPAQRVVSLATSPMSRVASQIREIAAKGEEAG